jgi:hypothetical protein
MELQDADIGYAGGSLEEMTYPAASAVLLKLLRFRPTRLVGSVLVLDGIEDVVTVEALVECIPRIPALCSRNPIWSYKGSIFS